MAAMNVCKVAESPTSTSDGYRALVAKAADAADGKEPVLNRDSAHACIIVEYLFRKATSLVEIVTKQLIDATYGTQETIAAALAFLKRSKSARIDILLEGVIPENNALICAIQREGFENQVTITPVPKDLQQTYTDHIIVCDEVHYRYQRSRENCAATAQFGNREVGGRLHQQFVELKAKAAA